jgi:hypothetical protein
MLQALLITSISPNHVPIASHKHYTPALAVILADPSIPPNLRDFFGGWQGDESKFEELKAEAANELGRRMNDVLSECAAGRALYAGAARVVVGCGIEPGHFSPNYVFCAIF